jgi:hypothetical protein
LGDLSARGQAPQKSAYEACPLCAEIASNRQDEELPLKRVHLSPIRAWGVEKTAQ